MYSVTDDAMNSFSKANDPRLAHVMALLVKHLHAFVSESKITKEEWMIGLEFLTASATITTEERNEFSLMSDIMGISSMVDVVSQPPGTSPSSVLGPFHNHDSSTHPNGADLVKGQDGKKTWVHGRVLDIHGKPIAHAQIDFWQNANNGLYPAQDPEQDPQNLRCKIECDEQGQFDFLTIRPLPYTVPTDGPVGALLRAANRHWWRPAHFHFIVSAPGYLGLVTEIFPSDTPYIDNDTVFGVRPGLVIDFKPCQNKQVANKYKLKEDFEEATFEFKLAQIK